MKFNEVEFSDEIEIAGQTYEVDIEASGNVDKNQCVQQVKLDRIHSQEHNKFFKAKDLSFNDMKRIIEKATDQLVEVSMNDFNPADFDDSAYTNQYEDDEDVQKIIR